MKKYLNDDSGKNVYFGLYGTICNTFRNFAIFSFAGWWLFKYVYIYKKEHLTVKPIHFLVC